MYPFMGFLFHRVKAKGRITPKKLIPMIYNVQNALPMVCIIDVDMPFDMLLKRKSKYASLILSRMKYHHINKKTKKKTKNKKNTLKYM